MPYRSDFFTAKQTSPGVYDRVYTADRFAGRFDKLFTNGVIVPGGDQISDELQVTTVTGTMKTRVNYGAALINGYCVEVYDSPYDLTHVAADATYSRIDRIIMELNLTDPVRAIDIKILAGVPAASPQPQALTNTDAVYQMCLADVLIPANVVSLNTATVTDKRTDTSLCGIANVAIGVKTDNYSLITDYVRQPGYGTTAGSTNTYTLDLTPNLSAYTAGVCVSVKIHAANTGASTINIDGLGAKSILDGKGNAMTSGKLRLNGIYTMRYDGTNFILQGEGGSGNATASNLLSGKTASVDAGDIIGTMPDRAGDTACLSSSVSGTTLKLLASNGYRDGVDDNVTITDADFIAANIPNGINIFGLAGSGVNARQFASGSQNYNYVVTGLSFQPKAVIITVMRDTGSAFLVYYYSVDLNYFAQFPYTHNKGLYGTSATPSTTVVCSITIQSNGFTFNESGITSDYSFMRWVAFG